MKTTMQQGTRVPIYRDAGYILENPEITKKAFKEEQDHHRAPDLYIYSRYRNPTVAATEEQVMALEGCEWALLTQSGMAAIDVALSIFQQGPDTGTWLFFSDIYGGTNSYIDRVLQFRRGLKIKRFSPASYRYDLDELEAILRAEKPRLVYFEAISNPMLIVTDCREVIRLAKKHGAAVVVDNTFATPYLWHPLEDGADLVIHSATKYLSGHNNITAGVVCGNDGKLGQACIEYRKYVGHVLSPDDAYRLGTQMKSFELRYERHCRNAEKLAARLSRQPEVEQVLFPGLSSHPTHAEALKLFAGKGFGAMITFDLKGNGPADKGEAAGRFIGAVSARIPQVPTLGDTATTLLHVESVWGEKYPLPGMIRLSVGIEKYEEIEAAVIDGLSRSLPS